MKKKTFGMIKSFTERNIILLEGEFQGRIIDTILPQGGFHGRIYSLHYGGYLHAFTFYSALRGLLRFLAEFSAIFAVPLTHPSRAIGISLHSPMIFLNTLMLDSVSPRMRLSKCGEPMLKRRLVNNS